VQHSKNTAGIQNHQDTEPADDAGTQDRRRLGRVVHDERGNAILEWEEAPPDYERPVLEIETSGIRRGIHHPLGSDPLPLDPQGCDPYSSSKPLERKRSQSTGNTSRTDLRKLSEWIKLMREMEQRKQQADSDDEE
jgi:hypothetical protein